MAIVIKGLSVGKWSRKAKKQIKKEDRYLILDDKQVCIGKTPDRRDRIWEGDVKTFKTALKKPVSTSTPVPGKNGAQRRSDIEIEVLNTTDVIVRIYYYYNYADGTKRKDWAVDLKISEIRQKI